MEARRALDGISRSDTSGEKDTTLVPVSGMEDLRRAGADVALLEDWNGDEGRLEAFVSKLCRS